MVWSCSPCTNGVKHASGGPRLGVDGDSPETMPRGDNAFSDRGHRVEIAHHAPYRRIVTPRRIRTALCAGLIGVALSLTLLPAGGATASLANGAAVASEPASKKKGPPPGATTKQIQQWVEAAIRNNLDCEPTNVYPCTLTMKWTPIKWLGTQRVCVEGVFGQPCLKYGTAYVARTDLLITTETQQFDWQNTPRMSGRSSRSTAGGMPAAGS